MYACCRVEGLPVLTCVNRHDVFEPAPRIVGAVAPGCESSVDEHFTLLKSRMVEAAGRCVRPELRRQPRHRPRPSSPFGTSAPAQPDIIDSPE